MKEIINIKDVKNSYKIESMKGFPFVARYFGRPLGDYFSVIFYNLGFSANQVTLFRFLVSILGYCLLFVDSYLYISLGVLCLLFAFVLDFVDGHIARLRNKATYWGKYLDGIVDYIFPAFLSFPISLRIYIETQNYYFISLSLICIFFVLVNRVSRDRARYFLLQLGNKEKILNSKNKIYEFLAVGECSLNIENPLLKGPKYLGYLPLEELIKVYSVSDIFVLPSLSDAFPLSHLEAMAFGLPVILTNSCGNMIDDGKSGYIIDSGDANKLADKILKIVENRHLRKEFSENARKKIKDYGVEQFYKNLEKALN